MSDDVEVLLALKNLIRQNAVRSTVSELVGWISKKAEYADVHLLESSSLGGSVLL